MSLSSQKPAVRGITRRAALAATAGSAATLFGQGPVEARVILDAARAATPIDPRLFGSFLEHLGRAIYEGIYEAGSKLSDARGFRTDVLKEIKGLQVPIIRYPGGNFVSGYNWLDGVGPKKDRPTVLDRAWNTLEPNQFGTNEFIDWCRMVGTEPLLATNLGSGTAEHAAALVEYCNLPSGSKWSDLRRKHGYEQPHNIRAWCLGNEMDGPWQIGHMTAGEYGRKAADAARQIRVIDRNLQLIACGSSGPFMPTYLEWDRQMLEECYPNVDAISLHRYYSNSADFAGTKGDSRAYLAQNLTMEKQIDETIGVCDYVRARLRSNKQLWLSFDEWNVWYRARGSNGGVGKRDLAPHLLEEPYNLEDALLVGGLVNSLLRRAERVKVGCLAQLVNVIAPIMTTSDGKWRNTIYYPYAWAIQHARGRVIDLGVDVERYPTPETGMAPFVDAVATLDAPAKKATLLALNRDLDKPRDLVVEWRGAPPGRVLSAQTLTGRDLKAVNTFAAPKLVAPAGLDAPKAGNRMTFRLPAQSYSVITFAV